MLQSTLSPQRWSNPGAGIQHLPKPTLLLLVVGITRLLLLSANAEPEDGWVSIGTPYFTVLSQASEGRTRAWAVEFEQFRRGLQLFVPIASRNISPVTVIIFKSERALRPFKPLENGKPQKVDGFFIRTPTRNIIAISLEGDRSDIREKIYHEGVHWYLSGLTAPLPLWLEEGLAEVFSTFTFDGDGFVVGQPQPGFTRLLRIVRPMPMAKFVRVNQKMLSYNDKKQVRADVFYAQSWAFLHYLLFGKETDGRAKLGCYLQERLSDKSEDAVFASAFGASYEEMDARLWKYLESGKSNGLRYPLGRKIVEESMPLREATRGEVAFALGVLLTGVNRASEATPYLRRATELIPADPTPWEAMAEAAIAQKNYGEAAEHYRTAMAKGPISHFAYAFLADWTIRGGNMGKLDPLATVSPSQARTAADLYIHAIEFHPTFLSAYEGLATCMIAMDVATAQDRQSLEGGITYYPKNQWLAVGLAAAELKTEQYEQGKTRLRTLLQDKSAGSNQVTVSARNLLWNEFCRESSAQLDRLVSNGQYREALQIIDQLRADAPDLLTQRTIDRQRSFIAGQESLKNIRTKITKREWQEAETLAQQLTGEAADPAIRREAERLLQEIERGKLVP